MSVSSNIIALFGHNGALGRHVIGSLLSLNKSTGVKVYHRPSSDTSAIPSTVEKVQIDYEDESQLAEKLKGVDVVVSTIGNAGIQSNVVLGRAVKAAGVKNFIPAYYTSHVLRSKEEADECTAVGARHIAAIWKMRVDLEEIGVPATWIVNGIFTDMAMAVGFILPSVARNTAEFYGDAESTPYPITSLAYMGAAIAEIASAPPTTVVNRQIDVVQFSPTGRELVDALETVNGSPVTITHLTKEEIEKRKSNVTPPPGISVTSTMAYFQEKWGDGEVLKPMDLWEVKSMERGTLVELVQKVKASAPIPPGAGGKSKA